MMDCLLRQIENMGRKYGGILKFYANADDLLTLVKGQAKKVIQERDARGHCLKTWLWREYAIGKDCDYASKT